MSSHDLKSLCCAPFGLIQRFFTRPFLDDDTFVQRCRKCFGPGGIVISVFNVLYILLNIGTILSMDAGTAFGSYIDAFFFVIIFPIYHIQVHSLRFATDRTSFWSLVVILAVLFFQTLRDVHGNAPLFLSILMIGGVVAQIPRIVSFLCCCVCVLVVHYYNYYAVISTKSTPLMFQEHWINARRCPDVDGVLVAKNIAVIVVMVWLVYAQTKAFSRQLRVAESTTSVAREVAQLLGEYRTEEANAVLRGDRSDRCDPSLLNSLLTIVRNMEQYRPHLPNYLLNNRNDDPSDGLESSFDSPEASQVHNTGSFIKDFSESEGEVIMNTNNDDEKSKKPASRRQTRGDEDTAAALDSPTKAQNPLLRPLTTQDVNTFHIRPVSLSRVSYASLLPPLPSLTTTIAASEPILVRNNILGFVERVHTLAAEYNAVVHSFIGDEVTLSWNSINRCSDHYYRSASFLVVLSKSYEDQEFYGAVVSGVTRCQRGGMRTFAWTLHSPRMFGDLNDVYHVARNVTKCVLTNHQHYQQIEHVAKVQAIDAIPQIIYEVLDVLLQNQTSEDTDKEWMYRIIHSATPPMSTANEVPGGGGMNTHNAQIAQQVTSCVHLALSGQSLEALSTMERIIQSESNEVTPGMRYLLQKLNFCVSHGSPFAENVR
eukprot:PhF_6_TR40168/c1_g1_i6/m.59513